MRANSVRALIAVLVLAAGCAPPEGQDEVSSASSGALMSAGFYVLASEVSSAVWINALNLHADGTFEASLGNGLSNDSGHTGSGDGTYAIDQHATTLTLTYAGGPGSVSYALTKATGGVQLQATNGDSDGPYTLARAAKPPSIIFNADWTVTGSGALSAGATVLVEYAASRSSCSGSQSPTVSPVVVLAAPDDETNIPDVVELPQHAQSGLYRGFVTVPDAHTLTLWFSLSSADPHGNITCSGWDSNFGKNFDFTIAE